MGQAQVPQQGRRQQWGACAQFQPLPEHSSTISQMSFCSTRQSGHDEKHLAWDAAQMLWWKCEYLGPPLCQDGLVFWSLETHHWLHMFEEHGKMSGVFVFLPSRPTLKCTYFLSVSSYGLRFYHHSSYYDNILPTLRLLSATGTHSPVQPTAPSGDINSTPHGWNQKPAPQNEQQTPGCDSLNLCPHLDGPQSWCSPVTALGRPREGTLPALVPVCVQISFLS